MGKRVQARPPSCVLLLGLALTALATFGAERFIFEADHARFRHVVTDARDRLRSRLDTYETVLLGTRSFVATNMPVERDEFRRYVGNLELPRNYPGIHGIGFAQRIGSAEQAGVEQNLRRQGHSSFRVWPGGDRGERHPIVFVEPLHDRNQAALGYDISSEPLRRRAMERARDTARAAATGKVILLERTDARRRAGFVIYVPVYRGAPPASLADRRAALAGFVYSPFSAADLLAGLFGSQHQPRVSFAVFDGPRIDDRARMATAGAGFDSHDARLETISRLEVAGVTWTLVFRSTPAFERGSSRPFVPAIALAGLLLSVGAFFVTRSEMRARAETETERNNLHALFTQAPAAIAIVRGPELRYELSNPAHQAFAGGRQLVGKTAAEALPELAKQGLLGQLQQVQRTGTPYVARELPVEVHTRAGAERILYMSGVYQPIRGPDGAIEGVMVFAYDVSDQVVARRKVEVIAEDLQKAVRMRDDFLSIAGHELRTPLTALKLQVQGLSRQAERGAFAAQPGQLLQRIDKAANQVDRLERLIGQLLDVSRIASGRLELQREPCDLRALIGEVVERLNDQLASSGTPIAVCVEAEVSGCWDRTRLDQVITNLLANAIKYGGGEAIEVRAGIGEDGSRAWLTVRDHGIGIDPQDRERIFERFERAVSGRHYGGLGLGLWISRQIVEAHDGRISVDGADGEGSAFTVELPRNPTSPLAGARG
jgi:signal transduction histidine kinase